MGNSLWARDNEVAVHKDPKTSITIRAPMLAIEDSAPVGAKLTAPGNLLEAILVELAFCTAGDSRPLVLQYSCRVSPVLPAVVSPKNVLPQ